MHFFYQISSFTSIYNLKLISIYNACFPNRLRITNRRNTAFILPKCYNLRSIADISYYRLALLRLNYPNALAILAYLYIRQKFQKSSFG